MQAVQFNFTIPRYVAGLVLGRFIPSILWNGMTTAGIHEVPEPELLGPDWVKVKTSLGGICGTDLGTIYLHTSPYYSPFSDFPFTFGHEGVGTVAELGESVEGFELGQRVLLEPTLWCAPRGLPKAEWCPACQRGETNRCQNRSGGGQLAPALFTGSSKDTGGSWSPYFLAHKSQLYAIPDELSDEEALLIEPFACGIHAVLADFPGDDETILILGAGTIGLVTLAALRALGSTARVLVSARYDFQADAARRLGADEVFRSDDLYTQVAAETGANLLKPTIGKRVVVGGADRVYECVGADGSLDDANRLARSGGTVLLVGVPGVAKGVDWSAIFSQELKLIATTEYTHAEQFQGQTRSAFDLGLELMQSGKAELGWMVSRQYALGDFRQALRDLADRRNHPIIKAAFAFDGSSNG
mgnify:CR=1 FL=1